MGGGKTETYSDLNAQAMFASGDNLYAKELVRLFAVYKKIIPTVFTAAMIDGSRQYFNPAVFEAMGVAVKNSAHVISITIDGVDYYIHNTYSTVTHVTYYYSSVDSANIVIDIPAYKAKDYLDTNFAVSNSYTTSFIDSFDMTVQSHDIYNIQSCMTPATGREIYHDQHGSYGPDSVDISTTIPAYEIVSGEWYYVVDPVPNIDGKISMEGLDTTVSPWVPNGVVLLQPIPEDLRTVYISKFASNDSTCTGWNDSEAFPVFKTDIAGEVATYNFFIFPVKNHGKFIDNTDYQNVLLNDLGLGNGILSASLSDSRIEKSILSYSAKNTSATFGDIIATVYGAIGNTNQVVFNTPDYSIEYSSNSEDSSTINFDGNSFGIGDKELYILPVDIFSDMIMIDRYKHLNEIFRIWANVEEETDLEWYQTGLFKLVAFVVAVILGYVSFGLLGAFVVFGVQILSMVAASYLSPEVMAIVSIILAIVAVATMDIGFTINTFAAVANVANSISQYYFVKENMRIQDKLTDISDEQKVTQDAIDEMSNDFLYIPFDSYTNYYDTQYSMLYNAYDSVYTEMYNFDAKLKPRMGVRNG